MVAESGVLKPKTFLSLQVQLLVEQEVSVRTVESVKFGRLDRARLKEVP